MADIDQAIEFVLHLEDAPMSGRITDTPGDPGGRTRYGLASRWHGVLRVNGFFENTMPNSIALPMAMGAYREQYAAPLRLRDFTSQAIANRVLAAAVNDGVSQAVTLLQRAINQLVPQAVQVDGICGEATVAAANRCMEASLLACFRCEQIGFHVRLNKPQFLLGWVRRDLA